jgi:uncharacterized protein (TIGR00369 family)
MSSDANYGVSDLEAMLSVSGLDFVEGIRDGRFPKAPIMEVLDFELVEVSVGRVVFAGRPAKRFYNPLGTVHGGWAATLLDSCVGCAIQTTLPKGTAYTTLELKVNYVRPIQEDTGLLRAEGVVIHPGRRAATASGELRDEAGRLYAHASTTCLVLTPS